MHSVSVKALETLLADEDEISRDLVCQQLLETGDPALPELRLLLESSNEKVVRQARAIISKIERRSSQAEFTKLCTRIEEYELEDCIWALARVFEPAADIHKYQLRLDEWAADVVKALSVTDSATGRVNAISGCLADQHGFTGNVGDYYAPSNSLLTSVIDSRHSNPISLCVLYMLVGKRAAMRIEGVNTPGHFLARHDGVFFDPFNKGRILPTGEIHSVMEEVQPEQTASLLAAATPAVIMRRMLGNLEQIFRLTGDAILGDMLAGWILSLEHK